MNLYEHTIIARQDVSPSQLKQIQEKYSKIVENNDGDIVKLENWGLMGLSYLIKKNKKGNYIHFKIKADGKIIAESKDSVKLDSCKFCHTEEAKTNVADRVEKDGYCIVPIENCPNP